MMKVIAAVCFIGLAQADPTRFLAQSAEIKPHGSFLEESEHDRLARKTAEAQKVFLQAMEKLHKDEELFEAEEKDSAEKAKRFKAMASESVLI